MSDSEAGTVASPEHPLDSFEDLAKQLDQPFEHEERLATAVERQLEIIAALDITKNQASTKLEADAEISIPSRSESTASHLNAKRAVVITKA